MSTQEHEAFSGVSGPGQLRLGEGLSYAAFLAIFSCPMFEKSFRILLGKSHCPQKRLMIS